MVLGKVYFGFGWVLTWVGGLGWIGVLGWFGFLSKLH